MLPAALRRRRGRLMSFGRSRSDGERKQMIWIRERSTGNDRGESRFVPRGPRHEIATEAQTEQCHAAGLRGETVDQDVDHCANRTFGFYFPVQAVVGGRALSWKIHHSDRVAALKEAAADGQEKILETGVGSAKG